MLAKHMTWSPWAIAIMVAITGLIGVTAYPVATGHAASLGQSNGSRQLLPAVIPNHAYVNASAYSSVTSTLIHGKTPNGTEWVIQLGIGLDGNDDSQYATFEFYANSGSADITNPIGVWGGVGNDWTQQGLVFFGTMTVYSAQKLIVTVLISNNDGQAQSFVVSFSAYAL